MVSVLFPRHAGGAHLRLSHVHYHTKLGQVLVHPCSFAVRAGQKMAIIGPNGAGKSTLLHLLAGRLKTSGGQAWVDDRCLSTFKQHERARKIALLSQSDHVDSGLRIVDYVRLGCLPHRHNLTTSQQTERVEAALEYCNLQALAFRSLGRLSGGERQRAHLARALAQQPQILLLDEPTNHLDARNTLDLLQRIQQLKITVVAVLHDLALVPNWAEQVAVMQAGRLCALGSPRAVMTPDLISRVFELSAFYVQHPKRPHEMLVLDSVTTTTA